MPQVGVPDAGDAADIISVAMPAVKAEVGCAKCIYKLDGATDCSKVAASINGQTVLITGIPVDAHALGLCSAAKMASLKGAIEDGKFVATDVQVQ